MTISQAISRTPRPNIGTKITDVKCDISEMFDYLIKCKRKLLSKICKVIFSRRNTALHNDPASAFKSIKTSIQREGQIISSLLHAGITARISIVPSRLCLPNYYNPYQYSAEGDTL